VLIANHKSPLTPLGKLLQIEIETGNRGVNGCRQAPLLPITWLVMGGRAGCHSHILGSFVVPLFLLCSFLWHLLGKTYYLQK